MRVMLDALDPLNIPLGTPMDLLATYIDHPEIDSHGLGRARFPDSIDVTISAHVHAAHVLDVETGAALPSDVPRWMSLAAHCRTVYCTADTWAMVVDACLDAHVPAPMHWLAHWDDVADVPAGCVAHQFSDGPPGNPYDLSAVVDFWPTVDAPPKPPAPVPPEDDMSMCFANVDTDGTGNHITRYLIGGPGFYEPCDVGTFDHLHAELTIPGPPGVGMVSYAMHLQFLAAAQKRLTAPDNSGIESLISALTTAVKTLPAAPGGSSAPQTYVLSGTATPQGSTS